MKTQSITWGHIVVAHGEVLDDSLEYVWPDFGKDLSVDEAMENFRLSGGDETSCVVYKIKLEPMGAHHD